MNTEMQDTEDSIHSKSAFLLWRTSFDPLDITKLNENQQTPTMNYMGLTFQWTKMKVTACDKTTTVTLQNVNCTSKIIIYQGNCHHNRQDKRMPAAFAKLLSAYVKCVKIFFRYSKLYSVTMMLSELALPRFEEIAERYRCELRQQMSRSNNDLVSLFSRLSVW